MNTQKTCLLIDDDQDDLEIFMIALQHTGKSVKLLRANHAFTGFERLLRDSHVLADVCSDLNMPGRFGKQCVVEIKKRPALDKVKVQGYSTSLQQNGISETKAPGTFDFITKHSSISGLTHIL